MVGQQKKFTDEELIAALEGGLTMVECAKKFECNISSVERRKRKLVNKGYSPEHGYTHLVPDGFRLRGVSQLIAKDKITGKEYLEREWIKSERDKDRQAEMLQECLQGFIDSIVKYPPVTLYNEHLIQDSLMAVLPIGDLHVGMMAWKDESGNNWSLKHVEAAVQLAFKDIVEKCPPCAVGVLINLGDFAHRDSRYAVTPNSGHHLDVDSRYPAMVRMCIRLKRFLIDLMLTKFKQVIDINVSGNHDPCLSIVLSECLHNVYENEPRVTIDTNPKPMHYVEFGKVMLATTHGDTIKFDKVPGVASTDECEMWGRTRHRYGLTGHIHSENKKELPGMVVESYRTLAPADSYAAWYGWRSGRDTRAIIFHKDHGKQYEIITGITMFQDILDNIG